MKKFFFVSLVTLSCLCSCGHKNSTVSENTENEGKTLVVYYSQTGATKAVAEEIAGKLGSDIVAINPVKPYDGDYPSTINRWQEELKDSVKVEILPLSLNPDNYDVIFLGFPIWGGTFALPVKTFLDENPLKGKKVITFATFGSGGIDAATSDVKNALPDAEVIEGYGVRNARVSKAPAEINRFLIENGYIAGEIEPLPPYSESTDVSENDVLIFDQACGNYPFPLGKPVKVATRTTPDGTDYLYNVVSAAPDGSESTSEIFVTVVTDSVPEFTKVVRH